MAISRKILNKVFEKTENDKNMQTSLIDILEFEERGHTVYKDAYIKIVERSAKEKLNEN